jgi:hypothetical protein
MVDKVTGTDIRSRGVVLRQIAAELSRRFRQSQIGAVRPGLTINDGTVVVTDNYLKLRIIEGRKRNERVRVRVSGDLVGEAVS